MTEQSASASGTYPDTSSSAGLFAGCTGIVLGVAHDTSIAWAIAAALGRAGMRLALAYHPDRAARVRKLADQLPGSIILPCDLSDDAQLDAAFAEVATRLGGLDAVIHSVAYAKGSDLAGSFLDTSRDGYALAQDVSAYSLIAVARRATPLLRNGGSMVTLSYIGGEIAMPGYGVMGPAKAALESSVRYLAAELGPRGIRVNAISAGPIRTLAARAVPGFSAMETHMERYAPLRRNVTAEEVADTALFLVGPGSRGITGEVIHVDAGFHAVGFVTPAATE